MLSTFVRGLPLLALLAFAYGCFSNYERTLTLRNDAPHLDGKSTYLKVHMLAGDVFILQNWSVVAGETQVEGNGVHLDFNRELLDSGSYVLGIDSVAIFETNSRVPSGAIAALSLVTIASLAVTIVCIADPKACFGSCPTFYTEDGDSLLLQAEGFSSSVAPVLERADIDALHRAGFDGQEAKLVMTNEAYETHVVRYADLLAAPKPQGQRVLATAAGEFWTTQAHSSCSRFGSDPGAAAKVASFDGSEWFTLADSTDLGARDSVIVEFETPRSGNLGVAMACRQTLLSTYLFYQTLAYMGNNVGDYFAALQRQGRSSLAGFESSGERLGNIEVCIPDSATGWLGVGVVRETGPLATDMHLVCLGAIDRPVQRVMLRFTKGYYRFDQVELVELGNRVSPVRINPSRVLRNGVESEADLQSLCDSTKTLVTLPGDTVELVYALPQPAGSYEYFLESRGYYLEWMREDWLQEDDQQMAIAMLRQPEVALRLMAPRYKRIEADLERYFWSSRYARTSTL